LASAQCSPCTIFTNSFSPPLRPKAAAAALKIASSFLIDLS
jgi:hypothetical protein